MSQKKSTSSTNPWRSLLTMEKFFIGYNLGSYGVFFVAYWMTNLTVIQDVMIFFGSEMLFLIGLMLYGVFSGLLTTKTRSRKSSKKLKLTGLS